MAKRPLQSFYDLFCTWMPSILRSENGRVITKAIYTVYGCRPDGLRDVLCLYAGQGAGGRKGMGACIGAYQRLGVEDVLFFCVDGLGGFEEAILKSTRNLVVQRCIVHMIRNSLKFVDDADIKPLIKDLKKVYQADTEPQGLGALSGFGQVWDGNTLKLQRHGGKIRQSSPLSLWL
ncbi:MAG: transposase [Saprospiraceae bacterium]